MTDRQEEAQEHRLIAERRDRLRSLREQNAVFSNQFRPSEKAATLHQKYADSDKAALAASPVHTRVAGRVLLRRAMGRAGFVEIQDSSGRQPCYPRPIRLQKDKWHLFL